MFYKKLIIISIFYLSLISYINIIELSNLEDINSNTVQINQNNNKKKKSITLRNDKKLIDFIKNNIIDNTQENEALLSLCYSNSIVKLENNTLINLNNEIINIKENNLLSLIYNEKLKKLVYTPRLITLLKNNKVHNEYYYKLHKKKFVIPFYIYDFVPIKKIPKDNDDFYIIKFDQKLREICKRKLDYNKHHFDILSYLACHEYELDNFMDMKYGDIYSQINDTFSEFIKNLNNNKYLTDDEIYVKLPPGSNAPLIFKGIQIKYNLYKIYNTKINDKYSKNEINSSKFITLVEDNGYMLVAVPDLEGLSYIFQECFIVNNSITIPRNFINYPNSIFMFYEKYMQDTDLKTIFSEEDINNKSLNENDNYLK